MCALVVVRWVLELGVELAKAGIGTRIACAAVAMAPALLLVACGGGGGYTPPTYALSGAVTDAVNDVGVQHVSVSLSGNTAATTSTDSAGHYSFSGLVNGSYTVAVSVEGVAESRSVTINGANVAGVDFGYVEGGTIASGIEFLPGAFSSSNQLRASLVVSGSNVLFTDSSDLPLKKMSLDGSGMTPLASRFKNAENVVLSGENVFWIDSGRLNRTSLDGKTTTVLAQGTRDPVAGATADIVVDTDYVYWVNTVSSPSCSPSCTWIIQQVPLAGGSAPVTVATAK